MVDLLSSVVWLFVICFVIIFLVVVTNTKGK